MKFQCERCKTRYSIADEKVRGKVLKIRCKNCDAVITVREGMPVAGAAPVGAVTLPPGAMTAIPTAPTPRAALSASFSPATPVAPASEAPASPGAAPEIGDEEATRITQVPDEARGAAGASGEAAPAPGGLGGASAQPASGPDSDEWYVSVDGDQEGPFSLAKARDRVAQRKPGEEMHAWKDDFDDWLPVEQVPALAPFLPRSRPAPPPPPPKPVRIEPRASSVRVAPSDPVAPLPPAPVVHVPAAMATPPAPIAAAAVSPAPAPSIAAAVSPAPAPSIAAAVSPAPVPSIAAAVSPAPAPSIAAAVSPAPGPAHEIPDALMPIAPLTDELAAQQPPADAHDGEGFDFQISEPSRIVHLSMLAPGPAKGDVKPAVVRPLPGVASGSKNGSATPVARGTGAGESFGLPPPSLAASMSMSMSIPPTRKRPIGIYLGAGGAVAAIGVVVILLVTTRGGDKSVSSGDRPATGGAADYISDVYKGGQKVEGSRAPVERPVAPVSPVTPVTIDKPVTKPVTSRPVVAKTGNDKPTPTNPSGKEDTGPSSGVAGPAEPLTPDEVFAMYRANQSALTWCYERVLKTDPSFKVSKIPVTITVAPAGTVSKVAIPNSQSAIATCLSQRIRAWRFRRAAGDFTMEFEILFR